MKNIDAVISNAELGSTIDQLRRLQVEDVVVETVKVAKSNLHQTMTYRGCAYEQSFTTASKIGFAVEDDKEAQAEAILEQAALH
jgi:nitrogen regulatory protein PII